MSANNNLTTLNGLFKEVYAAKLQNLIPDGVRLLKEIPFVSKDQQNGSLYHQPVILGLEHGVTFSTGGDAFTLNAAIAGQIKDAQVQGTQLVLKSALSYTAAARSVGGGVKAFEEATKFLVQNMLRSICRKLEIELLYGQVGYATVASYSSLVITVTTAEWAPGIWIGAENMPLEIKQGTASTQRCTANVVSVDMVNQTITIDSLGGSAGTPTAGDVIYHFGAFGNEFAGLHKIMTNTGTLFNIDASVYTLWKGTTYSTSGPLSFTKVNTAVARAVEKGLDTSVKVLVNPRTWADLLSDQAALRRYDSSYKTSDLEQGSESIKFYGQNGMIEITPSIFVKQGYAYVVPMDELMRVGSTDITFKRPGHGEEFFRDLETAAGYELRAFTDQALFSFAPAKMVLISGIVNSA